MNPVVLQIELTHGCFGARLKLPNSERRLRPPRAPTTPERREVQGAATGAWKSWQHDAWGFIGDACRGIGFE